MKNKTLAILIAIVLLATLILPAGAVSMDAHRRDIVFPFSSYITEETVIFERNYHQWMTLEAGTPINVLACWKVSESVMACRIQFGLYEYNPPPYWGVIEADHIYNPF